MGNCAGLKEGLAFVKDDKNDGNGNIKRLNDQI